MKHRVLPTFVLAATVTALAAAFAASPTTVGTDETEITAQSFVFDQRGEMVHFEKDVRVWNPGVMTLTCNDLIARMPRGGGVESIVATTGVRIEFIRDGSTNYATGDRAVYTKTNEVLVLTSQPGAPMPELNREGMNIRAEKITLDLGRGTYRFEGTQSKPVLRGKLGAFSKFDPFGSKTNEPAKSK